MEDPAKTLITQLQNDWSLTGDLDKSKITFRRGEPFDLTTRFTKRKISIEATKLTNPIRKRTLATSEHHEVVSINVWMLIHPKTEEKITSLMDDRQSIIDEIRRIIEASQRSLTDIKFSFLTVERHLDNFEDEPPVLHTVCEVECQYVT